MDCDNEIMRCMMMFLYNECNDFHVLRCCNEIILEIEWIHVIIGVV